MTISLALSISIDSDSYLNLGNKGYSFSFVNFKAPVVLEVAGLPDGVINFVPGDGAIAGDYLAKSPLVDKVAFTGSTKVGYGIMK